MTYPLDTHAQGEGHVSLVARSDVRAWRARLDCTEAQLRLAVRTVGHREVDVRALLLQPADAIPKPERLDTSNGMPRRLKRNMDVPVRPQPTAKASALESANRRRSRLRLAQSPLGAAVGADQVARPPPQVGPSISTPDTDASCATRNTDQ
jgi:hypothetical protein